MVGSCTRAFACAVAEAHAIAMIKAVRKTILNIIAEEDNRKARVRAILHPSIGASRLSLMDITNVERDGRGAFLIRNEDGVRVAEMTYHTSGESEFNIDHTEVDPSLRGQGVAERLLDAAVQHARDKKLKIRATCRFALKKLQNEPEFADVFVD